MRKFGDKTKSVFLNEAESHKLHLAFEVADGEEIFRGQPVKLDSDGLLVPAIGDGTDQKLIIGYSIHNAAEGDEATVAIRGFAVVWAMSAEALTPGAVEYTSQSVVVGDEIYQKYSQAAAGADTLYPTMNGIVIDEATAADELVRVILF
jgi:hypothetical protein